MNQRKARELRAVALHYYTDKIKKRSVTFKAFYRLFKKQYIRGEYNGK